MLTVACGGGASDETSDTTVPTTAVTTSTVPSTTTAPTTSTTVAAPVVRYDLPGETTLLGDGAVAYVAADLSAVVARVITEGLSPDECVAHEEFLVLHRVPLDGSAPVPVAGGSLTGDPFVGPGGRIALVDRCTDGQSRVVVGEVAVSGDVSGLRELALSEPLLLSTLHWSADGERLLGASFTAASGPDEPTGRILSIDAGTGAVTELFTLPGAIAAVPLEDAVIVSTLEGVSVHDASTGELRGASSALGAVAVSPAGDLAAVGNGSIDLISADGSISTLVEQAGRAQYLIWSPDGTVLVAVSEYPDGSEHLDLTTVATGNQVGLDAGGNLSRPALSPDGTVLAYSSNGIEPSMAFIRFPTA